MVNAVFTMPAGQCGIPGPERLLALSYVRQDAREAVSALFALDDRLGRILRTTREPIVGQMRLTWWHEALGALDGGAPAAEPVLQALAAQVVPRGITGARLAGMVDGWEVLLDAHISEVATMERHAATRGVGLFGAAAMLLGAAPGDPVAPGGRGWALADLGHHLSDAGAAERALALAGPPLALATTAVWSRPARCLGALVHIARMDAALARGSPRPVGSPRRVGRLLWHRVTGR